MTREEIITHQNGQMTYLQLLLPNGMQGAFDIVQLEASSFHLYIYMYAYVRLQSLELCATNTLAVPFCMYVPPYIYSRDY